jgi:hypothetical protein
MTQCTPETFSMLNWSLALIMGNIPPRDPDEERTKTRTKTATPNGTNRPSSENPTKMIEVSARTSAVRVADWSEPDAWV